MISIKATVMSASKQTYLEQSLALLVPLEQVWCLWRMLSRIVTKQMLEESIFPWAIHLVWVRQLISTEQVRLVIRGFNRMNLRIRKIPLWVVITSSPTWTSLFNNTSQTPLPKMVPTARNPLNTPLQLFLVSLVAETLLQDLRTDKPLQIQLLKRFMACLSQIKVCSHTMVLEAMDKQAWEITEDSIWRIHIKRVLWVTQMTNGATRSSEVSTHTTSKISRLVWTEVQITLLLPKIWLRTTKVPVKISWTVSKTNLLKKKRSSKPTTRILDNLNHRSEKPTPPRVVLVDASYTLTNKLYLPITTNLEPLWKASTPFKLRPQLHRKLNSQTKT